MSTALIDPSVAVALVETFTGLAERHPQEFRNIIGVVATRYVDAARDDAPNRLAIGTVYDLLEKIGEAAMLPRD